MENKSKLLFRFYIPIALLLLAYTTYRACVLSLTIDEAFTYVHFVPQSFLDIVLYRVNVTANNHILNTLLIKLFTSFFGNSELIIRLPSLLGHVTFLIASYLIVKKIKSPAIALLGFILLNFNPVLLDFFSLARGYAMASAFTLMSLNFVLDYYLLKEKRVLILSFLFAFLAVLSNFSTLIFYSSLLLIFAFFFLFELKTSATAKELFKKYVPILLFTLLLAITIAVPIWKLVKDNQLYFGGENGFWIDTVCSLTDCTAFFKSYQTPFTLFLQKLIIVTLICSIILLVVTFLRKKENHLLLLTFLLLMLPCTISVLQHILIGSMFMENRMGLFLISLFVIHLLFLADSFNFSVAVKNITTSVIALLSITMLCHTVYCADITTSLLWKYDCQSKDLVNDIEAIHDKTNKDINLGVYVFYEPAVSYYKIRRNLNWLTITNTFTSHIPCNYYYIASPEQENDSIGIQHKTILKTYKISGASLVQ